MLAESSAGRGACQSACRIRGDAQDKIIEHLCTIAGSRQNCRTEDATMALRARVALRQCLLSVAARASVPSSRSTGAPSAGRGHSFESASVTSPSSSSSTRFCIACKGPRERPRDGADDGRRATDGWWRSTTTTRIMAGSIAAPQGIHTRLPGRTGRRPGAASAATNGPPAGASHASVVACTALRTS